MSLELGKMAAAAPIRRFSEVVRLGEERDWRDLL
jgi:hypothetical protein